MKKRLLALLLVGIMTTVICACGSSGTANSTTSADITKETAIETTGAAKETLVETDSKNDLVLDNDLETSSASEEKVELYDYYPLTYFSNDVAWIEYQDSIEGTMVGLMNKEGSVVYSARRGTITYDDFSGDSYSYIHNELDRTWATIDTEGNVNVLYELNDTESSNYIVLAHGNGVFLVQEDYRDFSSKGTNIYLIDPTGKVLGEKCEIDDINGAIDTAIYYGEGIFLIKPKDGYYRCIIFNSVTNIFFETQLSYYFPFYEGESYVCGDRYLNPGYTYCHGVAQGSDFENEESWNKWVENNTYEDVPAYEHLHGSAYFGDNIIRYTTSGWLKSIFFDSYNNYKRDFRNDDQNVKEFDAPHIPSYPDGVKTNMIGRFSGGAIPLVLTGNDGRYYLTMVDKEGNELFDPLKLEDFHDNHLTCFPAEDNLSDWETATFADGIFAYQNDSEEYVLIDKTGNLSSIPNDDYGFMRGFDGNYFYTSEGIYDINKQKNIVGVLGKTNTGDSTAKPEENKAEKEYQKVSNFDIYGKWKNIGVDTYGQAQTGAIIVFNGSKCNFFSPNDTYAFYENGDSYILDCTSPLGDTVSFTVKIVDEDNIDIFIGGGIIELTRIE